MTSDTPQFHTILERVRRLEAQNQRLRLGGIAIVAFLSAAIFMGQAAPHPRVIEAQRFVLKDTDGNVRGWIGTIGKGSELTLGNVNAQPMMRLIVSTDSSDLHFFGSRKSGMNLGLDSGNPDISMMGAEANGEARIAFKERGPGLTLQDAQGFSIIIGATQPEKTTNGNTGSASTPSIMLLDRDKKIIWQTP